MTKVLCTFPGKHGDLLWALPTVRAISTLYGGPVDLQIGHRIREITPLVTHQPYIAHVIADAAWVTEDTAPLTPRVPPTTADGYDRVFHLGYETWPEPTLPMDIYRRFTKQLNLTDFGGFDASCKVQDSVLIPPLDLDRPWITPAYTLPASDLCIGFTDEHFELKYGLRWLMRNRFLHTDPKRHPAMRIVEISTAPRWQREADQSGCDWEAAAAWLARTTVFLGCCSALHVLACAVGTPVVLMEPAAARWQDVFYPYGKTGPQVQLVLGGDGRPTWDARHVGDVIDRVLEDVRARAVPQPTV
jgi:hypothetical protein